MFRSDFGSKSFTRTYKIIHRAVSDVCFTPETDMCSATRDVRYGPLADMERKKKDRHEAVSPDLFGGQLKAPDKVRDRNGSSMSA